MATKEERRAACSQEAYRLAETGKYPDHLAIENALKGQYPEARDLLDRASIRDDLNQICNRVRKPRAT
jgi:hypothetical protein